MGTARLHLGAQAVTLDFSGLFGQSAAVEWAVYTRHQRDGALPGNMAVQQAKARRLNLRRKLGGRVYRRFRL